MASEEPPPPLPPPAQPPLPRLGARDDDVGGGTKRDAESGKRKRGARRRHPLTTTWMQCRFTVTDRAKGRVSLEVSCPFHRDCIAKPGKRPRCTRSRTLRLQPGETVEAALERYKAFGRAWLLSAGAVEGRVAHMRLPVELPAGDRPEQDKQMEATWAALRPPRVAGGSASSSSSSSSSTSSKSDSTSS